MALKIEQTSVSVNLYRYMGPRSTLGATFRGRLEWSMGAWHVILSLDDEAFGKLCNFVETAEKPLGDKESLEVLGHLEKS